MKAKPIDLELMRKMFFYPPPTGELYWLKDRSNKIKALDEAGSSNGRYRVVFCNGKIYSAHRIIYSMRHNVELSPDIQIDHINGDRSDNRISNLRMATNAQNQCNTKISSRNKSGYRGVFWVKVRKKWLAKIGLNKKKIHLGYFNNKEEAALAYNKKALELFGEFAYLNKVPKV
jgi:hypothetical protein